MLFPRSVPRKLIINHKRKDVTSLKGCLALFNCISDEFCEVPQPWMQHAFITLHLRQSSNQDSLLLWGDGMEEGQGEPFSQVYLDIRGSIHITLLDQFTDDL